MRIVGSICALFCLVLFVVVLFGAGFTRPKALLGGLLGAAYFGFHAARDFAFEKRKRSPEFVAERERVTKAVPVDLDYDSALRSLSPSYRVVGDAAGLSSGGACRVVDLSSALADVRLEVKGKRVRKILIRPKEVQEWKEIVSTLSTHPPREKG